MEGLEITLITFFQVFEEAAFSINLMEPILSLIMMFVGVSQI